MNLLLKFKRSNFILVNFKFFFLKNFSYFKYVFHILRLDIYLTFLQNMFEPFLKSFFIRPAEPKHIKLLKLQVLTSLVSETNVQLVLRELQV